MSESTVTLVYAPRYYLLVSRGKGWHTPDGMRWDSLKQAKEGRALARKTFPEVRLYDALTNMVIS